MEGWWHVIRYSQSLNLIERLITTRQDCQVDYWLPGWWLSIRLITDFQVDHWLPGRSDCQVDHCLPGWSLTARLITICHVDHWLPGWSLSNSEASSPAAVDRYRIIKSALILAISKASVDNRRTMTSSNVRQSIIIIIDLLRYLFILGLSHHQNDPRQ